MQANKKTLRHYPEGSIGGGGVVGSERVGDALVASAREAEAGINGSPAKNSHHLL